MDTRVPFAIGPSIKVESKSRGHVSELEEGRRQLPVRLISTKVEWRRGLQRGETEIISTADVDC